MDTTPPASTQSSSDAIGSFSSVESTQLSSDTISSFTSGESVVEQIRSESVVSTVATPALGVNVEVVEESSNRDTVEPEASDSQASQSILAPPAVPKEKRPSRASRKSSTPSERDRSRSSSASNRKPTTPDDSRTPVSESFSVERARQSFQESRPKR